MYSLLNYFSKLMIRFVLQFWDKLNNSFFLIFLLCNKKYFVYVIVYYMKSKPKLKKLNILIKLVFYYFFTTLFLNIDPICLDLLYLITRFDLYNIFCYKTIVVKVGQSNLKY